MQVSVPGQRRRRVAKLPSGALGALARRPSLAGEALLIWIHLIPRAWWRRAPFLPLPDRRWLEFRLETAYGDHSDGPDTTALVDVITWSRAFRRQVRVRQGGHR